MNSPTPNVCDRGDKNGGGRKEGEEVPHWRHERGEGPATPSYVGSEGRVRERERKRVHTFDLLKFLCGEKKRERRGKNCH